MSNTFRALGSQSFITIVLSDHKMFDWVMILCKNWKVMDFQERVYEADLKQP